jgi:hypothetical protein
MKPYGFPKLDDHCKECAKRRPGGLKRRKKPEKTTKRRARAEGKKEAQFDE